MSSRGRIWQNLRSTRETELAEDYPLHVVSAWIVNTERIAAKHYLQVTDDHFESGARIGTGSKPVRYGTESTRTASRTKNDSNANEPECKEKRPHAKTCDRSGWAILDSNQ